MRGWAEWSRNGGAGACFDLSALLSPGSLDSLPPPVSSAIGGYAVDLTAAPSEEELAEMVCALRLSLYLRPIA